MQVNVITFGRITDITGKNIVCIENAHDTNSLTDQLIHTYPALADIKFAIAVNKNVVTENTILTDKTSVAILPPFSGG